MLKYKNIGYVIEIKLPKECGHDGYIAECRYQYDKEKDKYILDMWLKRDDLDERFKIDAQNIDTQYISGTKETIKQNICRVVEQACNVGFFNDYIKNFEYMYKCFYKGNELIEAENFGE